MQCQQRAEDLVRSRDLMRVILNGVDRQTFPMNGT